MTTNLNRLTNMVDGIGTTVYTYTSGGELFTEDGPFASDTVTNIYLNRVRVGLGLQQPTGYWTNAFGYDYAERLTSVASPAGGFAYTYDPVRLWSVDKLSLPNGSAITNLYDENSRLRGTWLKTSSGTLLDAATYGYNAGNQRITYTNAAVTNAAGTNVAYTYDPIGQLSVATSSISSENRGYDYDAAWNLNVLTNDAVTTDFSVNDKNELSLVGSDGFTYDADGNMTGQDSIVYTYDDEDRLEEVTAGETKTTFVYDGLSRLREQLQWVESSGGGGGDAVGSGVNPDGGGGTTWTPTGGIYYIYDGSRVIQERNTNNIPTVSYTRGMDKSGSLEGAGGIGGLLARSGDLVSGNFTNHNYYHADGLGNITYLETASQGLAASYRYDPFGNTLTSSGSFATTNSYQFSSKEYISSAGFYYYLYRFYSPAWQRWVNRDPIEEWGGRNLYEFVGNDPLQYIDLFGLTINISKDFPPDQQTHLNNCLCKLAKSPNGQKLLDQANDKNNQIDIIPHHGAAGKGKSDNGHISGTIGWNPKDPLGIGPDERKQYPDEIPPDTDAGCAVVLAHELGHVLNPNNPSGDDEPEGTNVHDNENPVRKDLHITPRKTYHGNPVKQ